MTIENPFTAFTELRLAFLWRCFSILSRCNDIFKNEIQKTNLFLAAAARSRCRRFLNQFPTCMAVKPVFDANSFFLLGFGYGSCRYHSRSSDLKWFHLVIQKIMIVYKIKTLNESESLISQLSRQD